MPVRSHDWDETVYMTAQDAALLLRTSDQTISARVKQGTLDGSDRGEGMRPRWLVSRAAVEALLGTTEQNDLRRRVTELEGENSRLRAEVARLTSVAQHLGVAAQAATAAAQQYLTPLFPPAID